MLLGLGKRQADLFDGPTAFALHPGDPHHHLHLTRPHRQQLETARRVTESNHVTTAAVRTLQLVRVNATVKDGLTAPKK